MAKTGRARKSQSLKKIEQLQRQRDYASKLRLIRLFTHGFDASSGYSLKNISGLSSSQKREINRYYDVLSQLTYRPHYIYRPRNKQNLRAAKRTNGTDQLSKIHVGIFQVPTRRDIEGERRIVKPKVKISRSGEVSLHFEHGLKRDTLLFEDAARDILAQEWLEETGERMSPDDVDYVEAMEYVADFLPELTQQIVDETDYKYYTVIAGQFEIGKGVPTFFNRNDVAAEVIRLQEIYNPDERDDCDPDDPNSHYWGNWLFGLNAYRFTGFKQMRSYVNAVRDHVKFRTGINEKLKSARKRLKYWNDIAKHLSRLKNKNTPAYKKRTKEVAAKIKEYENTVDKLILTRSQGRQK